MSADIPHISVCICTYRRPDWLRRLLLSLQRQQSKGLFGISIVVADNDVAESARAIVAEFSSASIPVVYCVEPVKNIAVVRNRSLSAATGNWIAFIDDDEFPGDDWLWHLFEACQNYQAQGALGPVRPHYEVEPPAWVKKCGLYDRPEHATGFEMSWQESRTGNVLLRRDILSDDTIPFSPEFPNGGEDQDFFRRMMDRGHRFIWCNDAIVLETVPPIRWNKSVMIRRALLRGKNSFKHADATFLGLVKSIIAIPVYLVILPFTVLIGMHLVMRYLIKLCDHLGRLLATLGINPIRERAG